MSEDELLAKTFYDILQLKADRGDLSRISKEPHDRKHFNTVLRPGILFGGISAIATFVALRRLPKYWMNRSLSKKESFLHGRSGNPLHAYVRKQGPWSPHVKTNRDGSTSFHEGYILTPFLVAVDATLACLTGCMVTFVTTPKLKLFQAAADIPLVEGTSAISDAVCSDFIQNYKRLPEDLWTRKKLEGDDVTTNIKRFVQNCQRRQQVERQLRVESGLAEGSPVSIPEPGVAGDLLIELDEEPKELLVWGDKAKTWLDDWMEEDDEDDDDFW